LWTKDTANRASFERKILFEKRVEYLNKNEKSNDRRAAQI